MTVLDLKKLLDPFPDNMLVHVRVEDEVSEVMQVFLQTIIDDLGELSPDFGGSLRQPGDRIMTCLIYAE